MTLAAFGRAGEGVSTRRIDDLVKPMGIEGISSSEVSRLAAQLDAKVTEFRERPLYADPYRYMWIDAMVRQTSTPQTSALPNLSPTDSPTVNERGALHLETPSAYSDRDGRSRAGSDRACVRVVRHSRLGSRQCSIARDQLVDELRSLGVTDYQRLRVEGPRGSTRPQPLLDPAHQVLRIGSEFVDVTWMQIDVNATKPWRIYPTLADLRLDWAVVLDFYRDEPIQPL